MGNHLILFIEHTHYMQADPYTYLPEFFSPLPTIVSYLELLQHPHPDGRLLPHMGCRPPSSLHPPHEFVCLRLDEYSSGVMSGIVRLSWAFERCDRVTLQH